MINQNLIDQAWDYQGYISMLDDLLAAGKTTGSDQSESMMGYARLNQKRMRKWHKIAKLTPELESVAAQIKAPITWLILTEGWCGDAAQCLPFINKIAELSPFIKVRLILRDENLELMDQYLTDGGRGIPKLICLDKDLNEIGIWGPRPRPMQDLLLENKRTQAKTYDQLSEEMHLWYAKDRGHTLQQEFVKLLKDWNQKLN